MGHRVTVESLLERAERTHASASRLARPGWLFARRRERQFIRAIEEFLHTLHHVPRSEAARATPDQEAKLRRVIDRIIEDVEAFLSSHPGSSRDRLERNQRLAARIYELQQAFEAIARGATPNPRIVDVRREEHLRNANQPKR